MISEALEYLRKEIRDYIGVLDTEVTLGHLHTLADSTTTPGARIGLVNVSQENTLRNTAHSKRSPAGILEYQEPPVYLNLFVVVAFDFSSYETNVVRLSETIELFQNKRYFDTGNQTAGNPFPAGLQRLNVDLYSTDFEHLNHLWGILGGTYFPSVIYKVRLLTVQADETVTGPEIMSLEVNTGFKLP